MGVALVMGENIGTTATVNVHIMRLRKKLGPYAACIVSRQGYGYVFEEN
jgi:DNA-binding response OmpR family regulator